MSDLIPWLATQVSTLLKDGIKCDLTPKLVNGQTQVHLKIRRTKSDHEHTYKGGLKATSPHTGIIIETPNEISIELNQVIVSNRGFVDLKTTTDSQTPGQLEEIKNKISSWFDAIKTQEEQIKASNKPKVAKPKPTPIAKPKQEQLAKQLKATPTYHKVDLPKDDPRMTWDVTKRHLDLPPVSPNSDQPKQAFLGTPLMRTYSGSALKVNACRGSSH